MGRRQKSPTHDSQTRRVKPSAKDAQNEALEPSSHQDPAMPLEARPEADGAQDEASVVQTPPSEAVTSGDVPTDGPVEVVELRETGIDEVTAETTSEPVVTETSSAGGSIEVETDVPVEETVETSVEGDGQAITETATDETSPLPAAAAIEHQKTEDAGAIAQPEVDSATALALRRLREKPLCCCGCAGALSGKHFLQGHDGKAKSIVRKIMRGEMKPEDAPPELILRHSEIKFIRLHPEFRSVVEAWRELCEVSHTHAARQ